MQTDAIIETLPNYLEADLNASGEITIDLMKLTRQHHAANVYKIASGSHIDWKTIVTQYKYDFLITTDVTTTPSIIAKLPLIGGRSFRNFTSTVYSTQHLNEWSVQGISQPEFDSYPFFEITLKDPTLTDSRPTVYFDQPTQGRIVCGGYLIWKSRYGGWMSYGFDILTVTPTQSYSETLDVDMFKSTATTGGSPYVETNYTKVAFKESITVRSIGVTQKEAEALKSIAYSPALYFMTSEQAPLELMRVSSIAIPTSNLTNGADVTISLESISSTEMDVR